MAIQITNTKIGSEEMVVTPDVLVIEAGKDAIAAALAISQNQPVVVFGGGGPATLNPLEGKPNITVETGARVIGLDGFPGNFTVHFLEDGQSLKKVFGAIVLALEAEPLYDPGEYGGVKLDDRILSLSQFDAGQSYTGKKVSFVLGKADADSLLSFSSVLKTALNLKEKGASEVNVFYEEMKVCADGLEQDYELARKKGVNFLKYAGSFQISRTPTGAAFQYREPFLSLDTVLIASDYLVLAEDFMPAAATKELAEIMDIRTGPGGFFQKDNVHFLPISSNRYGIFFVGSCHGPIHGTDLYNEVADVAAEVSVFAKGKIQVLDLQPQVEAGKCAACLTCYRCCPHHAIEIVHNAEYTNLYNSAARMNPLACQRCGICAAECPGKAIQLPLYTDQEILEAIKQPARIVVYACENSGWLAAEFAKTLDAELQEELQIVEVPCSGKIDIIYLLKALENGADGVMLCVCHKENCKYVWGNNRAEQRHERARQILSRIGLGDRIDLVHLAANQGNQFNMAVQAMAEKIRQSGANPGKVVNK